jgi:hypothetical protein
MTRIGFGGVGTWGCFLELRPGRRKHISKEGDRYLRTMPVQGAHYILGPFGQDSDLRRWGLRLAERGGKNAKKRARPLRSPTTCEAVRPVRNNHKMVSAVA